MNKTLEPWAAVKNGKWHKVYVMPQSFDEQVVSLCGVTFEPFNVAEGKPDYIGDWGFCKTCSNKEIEP